MHKKSQIRRTAKAASPVRRVNPAAGGTVVLIYGQARAVGALKNYTKRYLGKSISVVEAKVNPKLMRRIEGVTIVDAAGDDAAQSKRTGDRFIVQVVSPQATADASFDAQEILTRLLKWTGSKTAAHKWYRSEPIAALGDQTAEALVRTGQAGLVRKYLDAIAAGGYA